MLMVSRTELNYVIFSLIYIHNYFLQIAAKATNIIPIIDP